MKRVSQFVCVLLVTVLVLTTSAFAAESADQRASNYFRDSSVYLWKSSNSQFEVWAEVTAVSGMQELGASEIKVQRSTDKENWTTVKTYTKEDYTNMIDDNTSSYDCYVTYTYTAGYYYRAKVKLYAKNSSGTAYMTEYTSSLDLR